MKADQLDLAPPAIVHEHIDLEAIADQIKEAFVIAEDHAKKGAQYYRLIGDLLLKAKGPVGFGNWENWLKANCRFSPRHAQRYMRLAKNDVTSDLDSQWQHISGNVNKEDEPATTPYIPPPAPPTAELLCRKCRINPASRKKKCSDCKRLRTDAARVQQEMADQPPHEPEQGGSLDHKRGPVSTNGTEEIPLNKLIATFGAFARVPDQIVKLLPDEKGRTEYQGMMRLLTELARLWDKWTKRLSRQE